MTPIRFALIGAGTIAAIHAAAIDDIPDAEVAVVYNRGAARGRALAAKLGVPYVATVEEAVNRDDVDAVIVCTPNGQHEEPALLAAAAGKHILVEKPLEVTLDRIDRMAAAAEDAGVILACVFQQRYARGIQEAKAAMDAGRLGQLVMADAYVKWHRPQSYYDSSWHGGWEDDGGGALMNQAIHTIDLLQWLTPPVANVIAHTAILAHTAMETEDTAAAVLTYANGAMGVIQGATSCWPGDGARLELHGTRGTIILEEGQIIAWKLQDADPNEEARMLNLETGTGSGAADPKAIGTELHRRQVADMVDAIRNGRPPAVDAAEARKSVEIIRAIYHAAAQGRPVDLPLADDTAPVQVSTIKERDA